MCFANIFSLSTVSVSDLPAYFPEKWEKSSLCLFILRHFSCSVCSTQSSGNQLFVFVPFQTCGGGQSAKTVHYLATGCKQRAKYAREHDTAMSICHFYKKKKKKVSLQNFEGEIKEKQWRKMWWSCSDASGYPLYFKNSLLLSHNLNAWVIALPYPKHIHVFWRCVSRRHKEPLKRRPCTGAHCESATVSV